MSYYDRYIAKFPCNDKAQERQLVAATSLYMAVKINETRRKEDTIQCFFKLSDGRLSVQDITNMESQMLFGLNWLVNPPSPQTFVHQVTSLLCCTHLRRGSSSAPTIIYEVATYITELSLLNDESTSEKASTLGLASMLIVLRGVKSTVLSSDQIEEFFNFLSSRLYPGSSSPSKKINKLKETATFSELKNMYQQDRRYCSPLRERPVHRTTVPKPFSFQTDKRAAFKRRITPMVESEENYDRQFKALPMPNYDNDPFFHAPKMWMEKNFTVPEPFQLSHMRMATKKYRKTRDDIEVGRYRFKALPVPDFSYKTLCSSHQIELTVPFPFHLSVDERFLNRIRFHGTKRSNMLARVHIACLLEKEKSSRDLMNDAADDSSKASRTSTINISSKSMASNRRRRKENNIVESVEEIPRCQSKARPMPNFSKFSQQLMSKAQRPKSPAHSIRSNNESPGPASSAANDTLGSPGKHFKAKKMPNFSKPFAPRPKSPGHSMRSNPGTPSNADKERLLKTRPKSPGHSIRRSSRTPSPASSVAGVTVASTGSTFKAKKMRDFSKPFVPRPRSPRHSIRSNPGTPSHANKEKRSSSGSPGPSRNEKSLQSVPPINGPEDLLSVSKSPKTPRGFKAKKMPNFSKPFVPGKRSPHPADHSDQSVSTFATHDTTSGKSGRSRVSQSTSSFKAKAMPNFNKPFVPIANWRTLLRQQKCLRQRRPFSCQ